MGDFAFSFVLLAAMCALSNECIAHILCWSTWDELPGQLRVSGHWHVQGAFALLQVAERIVPDLSFVIQPGTPLQVRANRILVKSESDHLLLDMGEFRKIVQFQLWMSRRQWAFGHDMSIHDIVQHLLQHVHHGLVGSRLQNALLQGIPETACIQRNQIGFINLAWRRSVLDLFCLGSIVELLLHMQALPHELLLHM